MIVSNSAVEVFSLLHVVIFIVSQSTVALSETGPASTGMSRESRGLQGHEKCDTFYLTVEWCISRITAC